jgi:hypothetical protein
MFENKKGGPAASYRHVPEAPSSGIVGHQADDSLLFPAKVTDVWSFTANPSYTFRVQNMISGTIYLYNLLCKWCYNVSYWWDIGARIAQSV